MSKVKDLVAYNKLKEMVGEEIIRTEPCENDYSYTSSPIKLLKVTGSHLVYEGKFTKDPKVLGRKWIDRNWILYDNLVGDIK